MPSATTVTANLGSMLTMQSHHQNVLSRIIDKSQLAGHLIDVITTTMPPLLTTNFEVQEELITMPREGLDSQVQSVADSAPLLGSFHDLFKQSETPTDCAALINGLVASFSVILVSELGDKTFIITAIMAMKNSRLLVFISSALALLMMTILSVGMGVAVTVIPKQYTHYASIVLFLCFGLKMLKEAYDIGGDTEPESEFEEVQKSLEHEGLDSSKGDGPGENDINNNVTHTSQVVSKKKDTLIRTLYIAPIVIKVFTMILVAEWGDRSQISTVILAAREDIVGVFIGSLSGHVLCTGLAVIGGRFVADIISVRTMTLIGGIIFLVFATYAIIMGPE